LNIADVLRPSGAADLVQPTLRMHFLMKLSCVPSEARTESAATHAGSGSLPRRGALGLLAALALGACSDLDASTDVVSLETARVEHEAGRAVLIDIRQPDEHATGVAAGARLVPMHQLVQRVGEIPVDASVPVLLICNTQNRSSRTMRVLRERGYGHVRYVDGGMSEWVRRGWPTVKPGT
jgi:rhodanese-related sulfurtransferase